MNTPGMQKKPVYRLLLIWLFIATFSVFASAQDSSWMVGDNKRVLLSLYEHRAGSGDRRATDIALTYGTWILTGKIVEGDNGYPSPTRLKLKGNSATFDGTISLDYPYRTKKRARAAKVVLVGKLTLNQKPKPVIFNLSETIPYHVMDRL